MSPFKRLALAATLAAVLAPLAGCGAAPALPTRQAAPLAIEALAKAASEAQVKAFVRAWFKLLDRNAPTASYLPLIDDKGLNMRFPERTLRSHADFEDWYAGILRTVKRARHTLRTVEVTKTGQGAYEVHVIVLWEATMADGKDVSFLADQAWKVHTAAGKLRIAEYLVSAAQPGAGEAVASAAEAPTALIDAVDADIAALKGHDEWDRKAWNAFHSRSRTRLEQLRTAVAGDERAVKAANRCLDKLSGISMGLGVAYDTPVAYVRTAKELPPLLADLRATLGD